jgi:hypothetical protein
MRPAVVGVAGAAVLAVVMLSDERAALTESTASAGEAAKMTLAWVDVRLRKFGLEEWLALATAFGMVLRWTVRSTEGERRHNIPWDADFGGGGDGGGDGGD